MSAYAFICTDCNHLASKHWWDHTAGGTLVEGPYRCIECGCSQPQAGPWAPLSRTQYESHMAARKVFADPSTREQFLSMIERTETTEPRPDDPEWLRSGAPHIGRPSDLHEGRPE